MTLSGFVDLHTHGLGRYDTRAGRPADILKIAALHGAAGTGAILPAIYPGPISIMRSQMQAVSSAMGIQNAEGVGQSARILGVHLEGPFLNPLRCGALDASAFIRPTLSALGTLTAGFEDLVRVMTLAPELPGAAKVIGRCREMNIRVNMGHSDATYGQALRGKESGATGITHVFNAMRPLHHRDPGIAGLGLMDEDLYIEVIADGCHLSPEMLSLIFATKRLDRIILVSDSVKSSRRGRPALTRGGSLAGSGITLLDSVQVLRRIGVPDAEIEESSVDNPIRYLGVRP